MMPMTQLSAQLAARLGPVEGQEGRRGGSDYSKLRGIIRTQKDQIQALENEVAHFQTRLHRIEDGHRLELSRLKKEVEYHKRLRQGADQRSYELEDQLSRLQVQLQQGAARHHGADEEKDGLIVQSQLLVAKNSELSQKVKMLESQVSQLEELKVALENELNQAYCERDDLEHELQRFLESQHHHHNRTPAEEEEAGVEEPEEEPANGSVEVREAAAFGEAEQRQQPEGKQEGKRDEGKHEAQAKQDGE